MRTLLHYVPFACILLISACQPGTVESQELETSAPDSLAYTVDVVEKSLPCKDQPEEACLNIRIEKLKVTDGTSAKAMTAINQHLSQQLTATDNGEREARSPEEVAEFLVQEYSRITEEMPNYKLPWEYYREFDVVLNENGIFAVRLNANSFTGGAHPALFNYYYHYDVDNGKFIRLKDLIIPKHMADLQMLAEKQFRISRNMEPDASYEDEGYFMEEFNLTENYRYNDDELVFLYNPYEIAPYAEGEITLHFDYDIVKEFIRPEYRF